jgi:hypothetical protein
MRIRLLHGHLGRHRAHRSRASAWNKDARFRRRAGRLVVALLVAAVGVAGAEAAFATWSAAGASTASGTTGTVVAVTLTAGLPAYILYPGGTSAVTLAAANSNDVALRLGSLSLDTTQGTGGFSVDGAHSGCGTAALSFTTQNNSGAGWTIPKKVAGVNGSLSITLPNALAMASSAANACQGATFTVFLTAGP